jgi:hypothetical protein
MNMIHSYFTRVTHGETTKESNPKSNSQIQVQTKKLQGTKQGIAPKDTPPHLPTPGPLCWAGLNPGTSAHPDLGPNAHALAL